MPRRWPAAVILSLAAVVHCTALVGRPRQQQHQQQNEQPHDDELHAAAVAPEPRPMRHWLNRRATKGTLLVVAGGLSGAVAKTATAPLERAKLMSQAGQTANFWRLMSDVKDGIKRSRTEKSGLAGPGRPSAPD